MDENPGTVEVGVSAGPRWAVSPVSGWGDGEVALWPSVDERLLGDVRSREVEEP